MRVAAFRRGSLHAALQDASTWLAQQFRMEVGVRAMKRLFGHSQQHPTG